ncbi:hypothetical protein [Cupriavidus basilensis]|uniref:hypothetical protein n=1 Tax=Cupriavidus basilensis TaxID=68895 RepID=UPI0023E8C490|nr:hypothetical protein [Cupriavidus basilensis]MDF3883942.1 hypothetical protein [Cupriavidus basilensis]
MTVDQGMAQAEAKYRVVRHAVNLSAGAAVAREFGVRIEFRPITDADAVVADRWTYRVRRLQQPWTPGWSWAAQVRKERRRPRRVEAAAVYLDVQPPVLAGLILGRISRNRVVASIHFLSKNPTLDVGFAAIATRYLEFCAAAFGCTHASIQNPIPQLVQHYRKLGFRHVVRKKGKIVWLEANLQADIERARRLAERRRVT